MDVTYFNVDTDLLKSDISELESELTKMKLAIARIYEGVEQLNAKWDGSANDSFAEVFRADHNNVNNALSELDNYVKQLDSCRKSYDNCEHNVEDLVKGLRV